MTLKDCALTFLNMVISRNVREAFNQYTHPQMIHHNVYFPGDRESLLLGMEESQTRFPNKVLTIQHVLEEDGLVAVHSRLEFNQGAVKMMVVHWFRFVDGLIVEMWDVGQLIPEECVNQK